MSALVFMDTETTGLSLDDDIWEFAAIRREENGSVRELHLFIEHKGCGRLPDSFRADHAARFPSSCSGRVHTKYAASTEILDFFGNDSPHVVGAVPNFDTERLLMLLRDQISTGLREPWHYHLIDVENLAVGYLHGQHFTSPTTAALKIPDPVLNLPWDSNRLSEQVGVDPERFPRHTAMGDVRWAMAIYDAITGHRA